MEKTINCTNPSCNTLIPVPEGAMQIICPNCNTWHFPPSDDDTGSGSNSNPNYMDYGLPPLPGNDTPEKENAPQNPMNPYEPLLPPSPSASPRDAAIQTKISANSEALGFLVTDSGEHLLLKQGKNIIGRTNTDLIINDKTVSRKHCVVEITNTDGRFDFTIYDIGHFEGKQSTNGVFVSGRTQRLQNHERIPLGNGSSIRLGNVTLVLKINS